MPTMRQLYFPFAVPWTIGTLEADHYHYEAGIGYLIWIDPEEQIYFALQYDKVCGAENALRLARSIQILEEETP